MPIQRPREFKNSTQYGTPNTVRGVARANLVYVDFYNNAGQQQRRLLIERVHGGKKDYLELEGADRAMKPANDDLVAEVSKRLGAHDETVVSEVVEVAGELKVNATVPGTV